MKLFTRNMGNIDRTIRIIVGLFLLIIGPVGQQGDLTDASNFLFGILGGIALFSGVIGYCMFYDLTGSNTRKRNS